MIQNCTKLIISLFQYALVAVLLCTIVVGYYVESTYCTTVVQSVGQGKK